MTRRTLLLVPLLLLSWTLAALPPGDEDRHAPLANWAAPAYWTPGGSSRSANGGPAGSQAGDVAADIVTTASPLPFVPVTPCRIVNTRRVTTGEFDGPALVALTERTFTLPNGPCPGLPSNVGAWSLNVTAVPAGVSSIGGYVSIYPAGTTRPIVSTLNFVGGGSAPPVANAAIVPAAPGGAITVFPSDATHLLIDVNGYYGFSGAPTVIAASPVAARSPSATCVITPWSAEEIRVGTTQTGFTAVYISLPIPIQMLGKATRFLSIRVCYATSASQSYISGTAVRTTTDALSSTELVSDATDRSSMLPECYTLDSPMPQTVTGALTLALPVYFANTTHFITIGSIQVGLDQQ